MVLTHDHIRSLYKGLDKHNLPNDIKRLIITKYSQGKTWSWFKPGKKHGPFLHSGLPASWNTVTWRPGDPNRRIVRRRY